MRSSKKPIYVAFHIIKKVMNQIADGKIGRQINIYDRDSVILPEMVGFNFGVYNGNKFVPVSVTEDMIGMRLGEFSPTRKSPTRKDSK